MKLDDLLKPVSADLPCGEDLLNADDADFADYYFNVEDRLPTSYFNVGTGTLFDPRSVDHRTETAQLDALLKRSRDLRLLGIEAKFQILAGRFKGWTDAVQAMIALVRTWPDDVHPTDPEERKNALEELNSRPTVVFPLDYATLISDRRYGDISYRPYGTGSGKLEVRAGEERGDSARAINALGSSENIAAVDALHATLTGIRDGLKEIAANALTAPRPVSIRMDALHERLDAMIDMILAARSDLGAPAQADAPEEAGESTDAAAAPAAVAGGAQTVTLTAQVGEIADHRAAWRHLKALEIYFVANEPASLALILITQSLSLIGRPLVEALDALMESNSSYAALNFGTEQGFSLSMHRMRELAGQAAIPANDSLGEWREGDPEMPVVLTRDHAGMILKQIEDFFRNREPASPIPILLFKARNFLGKDFHAIVRELLPPSS